MEIIISWLQRNIWYVLFAVWGLPLGYYRSKFRKLVYQTDSWKINFQPRFLKELQALFSNLYPDNTNYIKLRNFYRIYLTIYLILFGLWLFRR